MNESHAKPASWRLVIIGGLVVAGIIGLFILVPCTLREVGSRAVLGRDIAMLHQVYSAVRLYHMDRAHYPASLEEPDFQPYIDERVVAFLREDRLDRRHSLCSAPRAETAFGLVVSLQPWKIRLYAETKRSSLFHPALLGGMPK